MDVEQNYSKLRNDIDIYVEQQMEGYFPQNNKKPKVIHDSVHGTSTFSPFEISFLDSPIVQRLRRISQTDVASFVYPAGNHNRFEHTVGVVNIVGQMVDAIFLKEDNQCISDLPKECKNYIYQHCRVAAILHDCGHGPFSHLSEHVFSNEFKELKKNIPMFGGASPHEILSYFIATSAPLKKFNDEVIKQKYKINIDLDFIGQMIVGYIDRKNKPQYGFVVECINGAFDADKLDYILRDAHSTGVRMVLDLQRLLYTLNILKDRDGINRLAIDISGVSALEEIVFNKMMLTSTIYHHQKVRAAGCMLKSVFTQSGYLNNAVSYLYYTDDMVLNIISDNIDLNENLKNFNNRFLPKRAFCFSSRTLENEYIYKFGNIMEILSDEEIQKDIIYNIAKYVEQTTGKKIPMHKIWIDCPKPPSFKEATQCLIKSDGSPNNYILLREVFPIDDWVRAFSENKWQGFVFSMPNHCDDIAKASKHVLEELFEVRFNVFATKLCKINLDD